MKIISWNTQGAKKPHVIKEVQFLIRTYKADMIFLVEIMVNEKKVLKILPQMGFDHFDYVLPTNHSGNIVVLWNNGKIHASPLFKDSRTIHMLIHDSKKTHNSILSGIYAPAQLNLVIDVLWCLMGNFNGLASPNEKKRGTSTP